MKILVAPFDSLIAVLWVLDQNIAWKSEPQ
jgi:hypothetical protein